MKPSVVAVTIGLLLAAGSSWAQTNSFQVSINGTITRDTDKFSVKTASLLSSSSNIVVLTTIADTNGVFMISIDEINPAAAEGATNVVRRLITNYWDGVQVGKGTFASNLSNNNGYVGFPELPGMDGNLMLVGTIMVKNDTVQGLSGTINGFWKHPAWQPTSEPGALFKGTLKTKAAVPVPVPVPTSSVD